MTFIPCDRFTLPNGLRVVVAPDDTAPVVAVSVHYGVGHRSEPVGRSGFAHLFEHLMFEGSESVGPLQYARLIQGAGGSFNATTTPDYTVYNSVMPAAMLETALFAEADRMRAPLLTADGLRIQVNVVKQEVRRQVLSNPYGKFPGLLLKPLLFSTFPNAHDGWGDFASLERATLQDCATFFDTYYAPGNAVLTVAGDVTLSQVEALVRRHFSDIPARETPARASFDEPVPLAVQRGEHHDPRASLPAVAVGYRMPDPCQTDDYLAHLVLIDVLAQEGARLPVRLAQGPSPLVNTIFGMTLSGPLHVRHPDAFCIAAFAMPQVRISDIVAAIDEEIERLASSPPTSAEVAESVNRWQTNLYDQIADLNERAQGLGLFELLFGGAELLPRMAQRFGTVTPEAVTEAAKALHPDNRAVLTLSSGGLT